VSISTNAAPRLQLSLCQARTVQVAREVLAQDHGTDTASLAYRIGALEWHLSELVRLADELIRGT
jgi:hypothetical protein